MNKKRIQLKYNQKIKLLEEYNKLYYNESNPSISDKEYDKFKQQILSMEKNYL